MLLHLLLAAAAATTAASSPSPYIIKEHNPFAVTVTRVHMVLSSHFDAGCKTPGCAKEHLTASEPDRCAKVGAGNAHGATDPTGTGEPWAYHIVNRYFDVFFPRAVALAAAGRRNKTRYTYMTQVSEKEDEEKSFATSTMKVLTATVSPSRACCCRAGSSLSIWIAPMPACAAGRAAATRRQARPSYIARTRRPSRPSARRCSGATSFFTASPRTTRRPTTRTRRSSRPPSRSGSASPTTSASPARP